MFETMRRSPLDWVHDAIEDASWERTGLDRVARWTLRPRVPSYAVKVRPSFAAPVLNHTVSVVIPCFNYGRYLPEAVASVLGQEGVDVQVIVVDDCSTDDSLEVAHSLETADPRVRVMTQRENQGHVRTFNNGLAHATGDFIVRLDADDMLSPGSLTRAMAVFEHFPQVGLVYGHPRHFIESDVPEPRDGAVSWTVWRGREWIARRCARGTNCITTPEAVIRASVLRRVGGLNTRLRFAQDMEIWLRVASVSDVARINGVDQALHRDHARSMSVNEGAGILTDLVERRAVFDELFATVGHHVGDADELRARVMRTLAREALRHASYAFDRGCHDQRMERSLVDFARDTDPGITESWAWRTYAVRSRIGPAWVRRDPTALLRVARVRARDELAYLQWTRTGL